MACGVARSRKGLKRSAIYNNRSVTASINDLAEFSKSKGRIRGRAVESAMEGTLKELALPKVLRHPYARSVLQISEVITYTAISYSGHLFDRWERQRVIGRFAFGRRFLVSLRLIVSGRCAVGDSLISCHLDEFEFSRY